MATPRLYASAPDKAGITKMIARFFCRDEYGVTIADNGQVSLDGRLITAVTVEVKKGRYRLVRRA